VLRSKFSSQIHLLCSSTILYSLSRSRRVNDPFFLERRYRYEFLFKQLRTSLWCKMSNGWTEFLNRSHYLSTILFR